MDQRARALIALAAVAVIVILFVIISPGGSDGGGTTGTAASVAAAPATSPATGTAPAAPSKPAPPPVTTVRTKGLQPVGGIQKLKVSRGDTVRLRVTADQAEAVHVHGYDIEKPVAPGRPARFTFKATIPGVFEIELEHAGHQIAQLTVEP